MDITAQEAAQCINDCNQKIREASEILMNASEELARKGDVDGIIRLAQLLPEDFKHEDRPGVIVRYLSTRQMLERLAEQIAAGQNSAL